MNVTRLRTDYMESPIGFDFDRPTLNWITEADGKDKLQSAYRIQVALDEAFDGILLDTGKVMSGQSVGYRLALKPLPKTRFFWRVMIWDEADQESPFSEAASFETGRMGETWRGDWIGWDQAFPQLRKGFAIDKPVKRARAYACGVGLYRLFVNGRPASGELLTPGINAYDQWLQYQTYDLTALLNQGGNAIGAWLGNGYYKGRVNWPSIPYRTEIYGNTLAFICELDIEYEDGSRETIVSDESWKAARSPYLRAEIYDGEVFDARLLDPDWSSGGFDDSAWAHAQVIALSKELLHARKSVPVAVQEVRDAKLIVTPKGETVLDFGQNFAGHVRFTTDAPAGTQIHLQFGEALGPDGNFYRDNMRTALAELIYIADGRKAEYAANFTFYGFRYARVTGLEKVNPEDFKGEVIYSKMERSGWFECDDERVNKLFDNAMWSQKGNFVDVPTDCPQRDERMGWTGDAQVFCPTAVMNMQCDAFYRKYLYDLKLEQQKSGYVPVVVPFILRGTELWQFPTTGWGDAAVLMPWDLYLYYGDKAVLEDQYESMKDWVDYMRAQDAEGKDLYEGFHLGDWLAQDTKDPDNLFGLTPTSLVATAYYAWSAEYVAKAAKALGKEQDESHYRALSERIKAAFRREFVSPSGRVVAETQTAYLLALNMNLLTQAQKPVAIKCLAERIVQDRVKLTTGFIGTPYLCPVLSEADLNEYAYSLLLSSECPSWLYEVEMGATTIWERWNSVREDGSFGPVSMNSLNHYAFGAVVEWLYRYACGINPVEHAPGFKHALIRPLVNDQLSRAKARVATPYGEIESGWKLMENGMIEVAVRIPFNARATIVLPDSAGVPISENGREMNIAPQACDMTVERGSGRWVFTYAYNGERIPRRIALPTHPKY